MGSQLPAAAQGNDVLIPPETIDAVGAAPADPFSAEGSNFNLLIGREVLDRVSGKAPHKSYLCDVRLVA